MALIYIISNHFQNVLLS